MAPAGRFGKAEDHPGQRECREREDHERRPPGERRDVSGHGEADAGARHFPGKDVAVDAPPLRRPEVIAHEGGNERSRRRCDRAQERPCQGGADRSWPQSHSRSSRHPRTNVVLILASAGGYFFLAGVQTFGVEFVTRQYGIDQALGTLVLLVVGVGGVAGVLAGGALGDLLLRRGVFTGRILISAVAATLAVVLFVPAIFTRHATMALPYITLAAFALSAQNPPLDAARLDIMVPLLWGRAEGVRTFLRTLGQAVAPVAFGGVSDYVFGGGRSGLQWTFVLMLLPLCASAYFLFRALRTYPRDVATAAAAARES
jgi:hypothetical protein